MNNRTNPWYTPPGPDYPCAACNMPFALANPERGKVCHQCKKAGRTPEKRELPINPTPCPSCESLRAALAERDAKIRELDAWLDGWLAKQVDVYHNFQSPYAEGVFDAYDNTKNRLRELGLITEEPK